MQSLLNLKINYFLVLIISEKRGSRNFLKNNADFAFYGISS
jgi:hypothetical protein